MSKEIRVEVPAFAPDKLLVTCSFFEVDERSHIHRSHVAVLAGVILSTRISFPRPHGGSVTVTFSRDRVAIQSGQELLELEEEGDGTGVITHEGEEWATRLTAAYLKGL